MSDTLPSLFSVMKWLGSIENQIDTYLLKEIDSAEAAGPVELSRAMVALRTAKDKIDASLEQFNKIYDDTRVRRLPELFDKNQIPNITLEEGFRVGVSHSVRASVRANMKDAAIEWLREHQLGDIVSETINASTLSAVARTMAEDNRQLDETIFAVYVQPTTSVTKTKVIGACNG